MSKVCEVCGKRPTSGHNVSHSMRHTKRRFIPNLITKTVYIPKTGESKKMKLCAKCLKTVTKG
jgi:large subunit ribosomal protein L28